MKRRPDSPAADGTTRMHIILLVLALLFPASVAADEAVWALLRGGGQVVLMRHATTTPGVGDPPGFRLEECATQRNLSDACRDEARRVGAAFRSRGVSVGRVLSSRWCRCLETARLAFGRAEPWEPLDSVFEDRGREPERTRAVRGLVGARPADGNLVLVTHGANIRALTGLSPAQGEFLVLSAEPGGRFRVAGRLAPGGLR
jgi:broad specificity phosphatase PhoE